MTRHVSDELLSAYLDGELSAAERSEVERHLAESLGDREMLAELQLLRQELAALPRYQADPGFAERVVAAATQVAVTQVEVTQGHAERQTSRTASPSVPRRRRAIYRAFIAAAAAILLMLAVAPWRIGIFGTAQSDPSLRPPAPVAGNDSPSGSGSAGPLAVALATMPPREGEAVVLRLRLPADQPAAQAIDAALAAAGIGHRPASDLASGAMQLSAAYRQQVEQERSFAAETVAAADALYLEAPLEQIESVMAAIEASGGRPPLVAAVARLTFPQPGALEHGEGEGEGPGSATGEQPHSGEPFAQRLNAGMFRLDRDGTALPSPPGAAQIDRQAPLRILLLVEREVANP